MTSYLVTPLFLQGMAFPLSRVIKWWRQKARESCSVQKREKEGTQRSMTWTWVRLCRVDKLPSTQPSTHVRLPSDTWIPSRQALLGGTQWLPTFYGTGLPGRLGLHCFLGSGCLSPPVLTLELTACTYVTSLAFVVGPSVCNPWIKKNPYVL